MPNKKRILLIEDETDLVELYKLKLEEAGYELKTATKGYEGLELAKKEEPQLILLDIILPQMDGFAVLKELKSDKATQHIPIILLTNLGQKTDIEKGQKLGADDYLVKANLTPTQIIAKIKSYLK